MKFVFFGESPADQAALAVFTEGILGYKPEVIDMGLEGHGVGGVLTTLNGVFRGVYYNSDAEGLVVVVDSDDTPLHHPDHEKPGASDTKCRYCEIQKIIGQARGRLTARPGRPTLKVAIGLGVPAIEAWYLVGKNHQIGEAARRTHGQPHLPRNQLKKLVYGTDRPSIELETECAVREAHRIIHDLKAIETAFPVGFGSMANEIRSWTSRRTEAPN